MTCTSGIGKSIISNCETMPIGGIEVEAYICNRTDLVPTFDITNKSKITDIDMVAGKFMYKISGVSKNMNAGHDRVVSDDLADTFTHYFAMKGFEFDSASVENFDSMKDLVVFVDAKNKVDSGDGVIVAYGVKCGLYPSTDTRRFNDMNSVRSIELTSKDQQTEPYSQYNVLIGDPTPSYALTKAALEALLAP